MINIGRQYMQSFPLSSKVWVHESLDNSERGPIKLMRPYFTEMVAFLENIRQQPFECQINCFTSTSTNHYIYRKEFGSGFINVQDVKAPLILISVISHELCHYIMDNQIKRPHQIQGKALASFEEVFAEMFSQLQLKKYLVWSRLAQPGWSLLEPAVIQLLQQHNLRALQLHQKGIEALPLLDKELLPDYGNCVSVAQLLLPYFEVSPELWHILPHVQEVDPRASWKDFFAHMQQSAPDSCRKPLANLVQTLFS